MPAEEVGPSRRVVSVMVGVIVGCIFAYAYQVNLPTLFYEMNVASLVVFVAIPLLAGFVVGLIHPEAAVKNGSYAGLISGIFNSVVATVKLIYTATLAPGEIYSFSLFALISVFVWTALAVVGAELASKFYE